MTVLIGVTVVFGMLLLLVAVFQIFGALMTARIFKEIKGEDQPAAAPAPTAPVAASAAPAVAPIVGNTETVRTAPEVDKAIPAETVAVISAAVAAMAPAGKQYAVQGIRKA
ncbi:MAG: OadG family protein [Clostridia bacterium]|nr:OadG family protein [Clostridia bacterium]